jgi:hypothetical protein
MTGDDLSAVLQAFLQLAVVAVLPLVLMLILASLLLLAAATSAKVECVVLLPATSLLDVTLASVTIAPTRFCALTLL